MLLKTDLSQNRILRTKHYTEHRGQDPEATSCLKERAPRTETKLSGHADKLAGHGMKTSEIPARLWGKVSDYSATSNQKENSTGSTNTIPLA